MATATTEEDVLIEQEQIDTQTEKQLAEAGKFYGQHLIRVDPTTGKAHESNKQTFWMVMHSHPGRDITYAEAGLPVVGPEKVYLQLQRFWRHKTYQAAIGPNDSKNTVTRHQPYVIRNKHGDVVDSGTRAISLEDFKKQYRVEV